MWHVLFLGGLASIALATWHVRRPHPKIWLQFNDKLMLWSQVCMSGLKLYMPKTGCGKHSVIVNGLTTLRGRSEGAYGIPKSCGASSDYDHVEGSQMIRKSPHQEGSSWLHLFMRKDHVKLKGLKKGKRGDSHYFWLPLLENWPEGFVKCGWHSTKII